MKRAMQRSKAPDYLVLPSLDHPRAQLLRDLKGGWWRHTKYDTAPLVFRSNALDLGTHQIPVHTSHNLQGDKPLVYLL